MSYEVIKLGVLPNDGTGDPLRVAFEKINSNFSSLFDADPSLTPDLIKIGGSINDGSGDTLRVAFDKLNKNFNQLYTLAPSLKPIKFSINDPWRVTFEKVNTSFANLFEIIPVKENPIVEIITPTEEYNDASYSGNINITNNFNIVVNNTTVEQPYTETLKQLKSGPLLTPLSIPVGPFGVQEVINVGAQPNDGTGDPLRTAFQKINNNFSNLFYTTTNTNQAYSIGLDTNQVLLEIPKVVFNQGVFQIQSTDVDSSASQDITITAQLNKAGTGVKFVGYGTTFSNTTGICNYDMDVSGSNVRLLTNPIANTTIFHFIASQVTFTGNDVAGIDIGLNGYSPDDVLSTQNDLIITTETA